MSKKSAPQLDRIIRPAEAAEFLGYKSRSGVYDLVVHGELPAPIRVSPRCSGWRLSTLEAFLARRERASTSAAA